MTRVLADAADNVSGSDVAAADAASRISRQIGASSSTTTKLLTPTLAKPPLRIGVLDPASGDADAYMAEIMGFAAFPALSNATGAPAMSVPLYWNGDGLPIGVQFVGRLRRRSHAAAPRRPAEQARPWAAHRLAGGLMPAPVASFRPSSPRRENRLTAGRGGHVLLPDPLVQLLAQHRRVGREGEAQLRASCRAPATTVSSILSLMITGFADFSCQVKHLAVRPGSCRSAVGRRGGSPIRQSPSRSPFNVADPTGPVSPKRAPA